MNTESDDRNSFLHLTGIIIIIAGVLCSIGPLLPHLKISDSYGVARIPFLIFQSPRLILFIGIGIASIFAGIYRKFLLSAIFGLIYGLLFLLDVIYYNLIVMYKYFTFSIGFYFMFIGILALLLFGAVGFVSKIRER